MRVILNILIFHSTEIFTLLRLNNLAQVNANFAMENISMGVSLASRVKSAIPVEPPRHLRLGLLHLLLTFMHLLAPILPLR